MTHQNRHPRFGVLSLLAGLAILIFTFNIFAQATNSPPAETPPGATAPSPLTMLIGLIPLIVPIIVAIGKFIFPRLPAWTLPILAPALGALIDWIGSLATGQAANPLTSALLGSAGVGIRELVDQLKQRIGDGPKVNAPIMAMFLMLIFMIGSGMSCRQLDPGADPFVVRVEQTEKIAKASFDAIMHIEDSNRPFFRTNAPPFHEFVESLRIKQTVNGETMPRCSAMIMSLDNVKLDYKASRASSNQVYEVLLTLQSMVRQAEAWQNVITNR